MTARRREALMLAAIAALVIVLLLPNSPAGRVPSEDASVFIYAADTIALGGAPYRGVWDHKPPGIYLVDALGGALGGLWGMWALQVIALLCAAVLSYRAFVAGGLGSPAAPFGTIAWLLAAPRLYLEDGLMTTYPELFALPLQLAALLLFVLDEKRSAPTWRTPAIGALAAAAVLLKPTVAAVWVAIVVVLLVMRARRGLWTDLTSRLVLVATPGAVVLALAVAWLAMAGALGDAIDQAVRYNATYSSFASPGERAAAIAGGLRLTVPSGLAVLAVAGWILAARGPRPPLVTVALVALPLELAFASAGRGYHYYFIAWLPAMGCLAAYLASRVHIRIGGERIRGALTVALVAMAILPAALVARLTLTPDDGASREAAAYVRANTAASDRILVWGSRTEILVLAERRAPSRFVYQYAPLATRGYASASRIDEFLAELTRARPLLIVDASKDSFVTPPLDRAGLASWASPEPQYAWLPETARIVEFVEANYEKVATLEQTGWPVWRLRSP